MTWELRKIGGSGRLCLLLVLAVLCNGVLFALHAAGDAGGYTVSALRQAMAQKDLPGYEERLWQELEQAAYTGTRSEYDALRRELSAADAALARVRQAEEYPSFRAGLAAGRTTGDSSSGISYTRSRPPGSSGRGGSSGIGGRSSLGTSRLVPALSRDKGAVLGDVPAVCGTVFTGIPFAA